VFNVAGIGAAVQSQVESLTVDDSSTVTWPQQQRMAWHMFLDHPILGIGLGNFTFFVDRYSEMNAEEYARGYHYIANTDSIYTSVLAEMGLLGFFTFIGLVTYPAWVVIRDARHVDREDQIILVGLVTGYVAVLMVYAAQGLFFFAHVWAAMGILYSAWRVTIRLKRATPDTIGTTPFATSASASTAETRPMLSLSTTKHRAIQ
jgi:O-antigen ligase